MTPSVRASAVYRHAQAPSSLPHGLRLRALEWGVFFAATGRHSVAQVGRALAIADADRDAAFARLLSAGLLVERELSLGEYVRAAASSGEDRELDLREFLAVPAASPLASPPAAGHSAAALPTPPAFVPLAVPAVAPKPARRLSLKALLTAIAGRASSPEAGQLDVYRVFLQVDPRLLERNGITTLRFTEERDIHDPQLQQAIVAAVEHVLGMAVPAAAWQG